MFYITHDMHGFPHFDSFKGFCESLRKILTVGFGEVAPDSINNNIITMNKKYSINENSVYMLSDGINIVYSKLKIIDSNNFQIIENIDFLNKTSVIISTPPAPGWKCDIKNNVYIFSCLDFKIEFNANANANNYAIIKNGIKSGVSSARDGYNSNCFSILSNPGGDLCIKVSIGGDVAFIFFNNFNDMAVFSDIGGSTVGNANNIRHTVIYYDKYIENEKLRLINNGPKGNHSGNNFYFGLSEETLVETEELSFSGVFCHGVPLIVMQTIGNIHVSQENDKFLNINDNNKRRIILMPTKSYMYDFTSIYAFYFNDDILRWFNELS